MELSLFLKQRRRRGAQIPETSFLVTTLTLECDSAAADIFTSIC